MVVKHGDGRYSVFVSLFLCFLFCLPFVSFLLSFFRSFVISFSRFLLCFSCSDFPSLSSLSSLSSLLSLLSLSFFSSFSSYFFFLFPSLFFFFLLEGMVGGCDYVGGRRMEMGIGLGLHKKGGKHKNARATSHHFFCTNQVTHKSNQEPQITESKEVWNSKKNCAL